MPTLLALLALACAEPEPCDTLCESAGFDNLDEQEDEAGLTCHCFGGDGLGGSVTQDACEDYCEAVGSGADAAEVQDIDVSDDACFCSSD